MLSGIKEELSPFEALWLTIVGEARGEPIEGQIAVGWVIKNRQLHNPNRYRDYRDVCFEHLQFSCWNEDDPNRGYLDDLIAITISNKENEIADRYVKQCMYVAIGIDEDKIIDNTNGALNYFTRELFNSPHRPVWSKRARNVLVKGNQVFFNV